MKQFIGLTKKECEYVLSLINNAIGYNKIFTETRDYEEWFIDRKEFDFLLERLKLNFNITSLTDGRIVNYNVGNYFNEHVDRFEKHPYRSFTLIIQLSDNYSGGTLLIEDKEANKDLGNCILFDSGKVHSVSKIKSGNRKSLVFWLEDKNIKKEDKNIKKHSI